MLLCFALVPYLSVEEKMLADLPAFGNLLRSGVVRGMPQFWLQELD